MANASSRSGIFQSRVVRRRSLCDEHFELTMELSEFPPAGPGQFLQVLCHPPDAADAATMLRRPFSIGGLRRAAGRVEIDLLGRVVGPGTSWLNDRAPGDSINIIGPLGHGFTTPRAGERALFVAGGIGLPPIRWFAETLANTGISCTAIVGARRASLLPLALAAAPANDGSATMCAQEFSRVGVPCAVTTEDGTCGLRGRVTDAMQVTFRSREGHPPPRVYACGPEPMLRAVAELSAQHGAPCELAMERVMGCGMGTCQSCVLPVDDPARPDGWRYALCCTEGPVFDARHIRWT